jgi:Acyl-CoA carboxylase epsilon subunit
MVTDSGPAERPPVLRVIRGDATPEEIAAVVAALLSRAAVSDAPPPRPAPSAWADRSRLLRRPLHPGPDAWRRSALPG